MNLTEELTNAKTKFDRLTEQRRKIIEHIDTVILKWSKTDLQYLMAAALYYYFYGNIRYTYISVNRNTNVGEHRDIFARDSDIVHKVVKLEDLKVELFLTTFKFEEQWRKAVSNRETKKSCEAYIEVVKELTAKEALVYLKGTGYFKEIDVITIPEFDINEFVIIQTSRT